jgi:DNA-binding LacI/PurR family transcriptional regulator
VVAVHDLPVAEHLVPSLTTVRMPLEDLGRRAIEVIGSVPASAPVEEVVAGHNLLMQRASTAPPGG